MYIRNDANVIDGMAFIQMMDSAKVLAATGKYEPMIGGTLCSDNCPEDLKKLIKHIENSRETELVTRQGNFLGIYKQSPDKFIRNYIILETQLNSENLDLIKLFLTNFSLAIDNFMLNMNVNETQNEIIFRISEIVENRCDSTANHLRRVSNLSKLLAKNMGMDDETANSIALASAMHDVGKIGISDRILLKPGKLTIEEYEDMKRHTSIGYNIFKGSKLSLLNMAAGIALYHHERYDGKGYPTGKRGGDIPTECEIVAVADVFDALISKRCYKEKWPESEVIDYFLKNRGTQFSPEVVDTLLDSVLEIVHSFPD
jgi:response regulator RpfG family c-di-GMP phosphodiesterase